LGVFVGIAGGYKASLQTGLPFLGRVLLTLFLALISGWLLATGTYFVMALFYAMKGQPKGALKPDESKAGKGPPNLFWVGSLVVIVVLWANAVSKQGRNDRNPPSQPEASATGDATEPDAKAQAAADFERTFFERYSDLKPYKSLVDTVAVKIYESGNMPESRAARMEAFAKAAREELARQRRH
jgi:hypothetical protein